MRSPLRSPWPPVALITAGSVAAVVGRRIARRRAARAGGPVPPSPAPLARAETAPAVAPPRQQQTPPPTLALERFAGGSPLPLAVAEAYREARRAFNVAREHPDEAAFTRLAESAAVLWSCATLAEAASPVAARALARDARKLVRLLEERRDVLALGRAVGGAPAPSGELRGAQAHLTRRAEVLERRITAHGKSAFASKPSRVAGRLAEGH